MRKEISRNRPGGVSFMFVVVVGLHSFIPTNWLPFSIVGRAQKWTLIVMEVTVVVVVKVLVVAFSVVVGVEMMESTVLW
ncbi:hypothetical protein C5167_016170 [Papaver somniferum]|nr:hypothetical protein C5167_016170 [Papaver somniferum]